MKHEARIENPLDACLDPQGVAHRRFLAAMLRQGIMDYVSRVEGSPSYPRVTAEDYLYFRRTEEWFHAEEPNTPMSFVWICTLLGLDPVLVRQSVQSRQKVLASVSLSVLLMQAEGATVQGEDDE